MDPRNGEVLSLVSLPAYDPNSFAGGVDRATWSALNTDRAAAAAESRHPGTLLAGFDVQDCRSRRRRSKKA